MFSTWLGFDRDFVAFYAPPELEIGMRNIGLIGGMSWESTAVYYRHLNEIVRDRLGGLASADLVMRSVNFADIAALQTRGQWTEAAGVLSEAAQGLERAGADCVLICSNTMHKVADEIAASVSVPLIHIVDVTARALIAAGRHRPLLLATAYTMEQDFYLERMRRSAPLQPMVPDARDRARVHRVIFEELCQGRVEAASRADFVAIIDRAKAAGADSVILGCTEICLLIDQQSSSLPVFDSTRLHAEAAVDFALASRADSAAAWESTCMRQECRFQNIV